MKQEIETIQEVLNRMRERLKEETKPVREYEYVVGGAGRVSHITAFVEAAHAEFIAQGRAFCTKEEAELFRDKERLIATIKREFPFDDIDWTDAGQDKWFFQLDRHDSSFCCCCTDTYQGSSLWELYFKTAEDRDACIAKYGDEIKRVLGVK